MSENKSKQNTSVAPLIATIIVAVAAIALAIVAILTLRNKDSDADNSSQQWESSFVPSETLLEECTYAAHDLVADSYSIIRLFVTEGLAHYDEPYGNLPEDGIYTVNSTEYTSLEQIEELVRSVFVNAEAERILTNIDGNGMAVYLNREVLVDIVYTDEPETDEARPLYTTENVLGINADFVPDSDYSKDWSSVSIAVLPKSETECELTIYLGGYTPAESGEVGEEPDPDSVLETAMVKIDGEWRLSVFVY